MHCLTRLRQCRDEKRNIAVHSESVDCVRNIAIQVKITSKNQYGKIVKKVLTQCTLRAIVQKTKQKPNIRQTDLGETTREWRRRGKTLRQKDRILTELWRA